MSARKRDQGKKREVREIEADIARTRGRIDHTLAALKQKLSPGTLAQGAIKRITSSSHPVVKRAADATAIVRAVIAPADARDTTRSRSGKSKKASRKKTSSTAKKVGMALADAAAAAVVAALATPSDRTPQRRTSRRSPPVVDMATTESATARDSRSVAGSARRSRSSARRRQAR